MWDVREVCLWFSSDGELGERTLKNVVDELKSSGEMRVKPRDRLQATFHSNSHEYLPTD